MNRENIAIEEMKLLQNIIARQDEFKARTKNWAVTLVAALVMVQASGQVNIGFVPFIVVAVTVPFAFMIIESVFGAAEILAENRVREVEIELSNECTNYSGPSICDSMLKPISMGQMRTSLRNTRTWLLYIMLTGLGVISAILNCSISHAP